MALNFSITLPCKPYVRVFIEQNYGKPVRFYRDKGLMVLIRLLLGRKDTRLDFRPINPNVYSETVSFHINENDYNHYGGILSNQAIMDLNQYFESKVKHLMRTWCAAQTTYGMTQVDAVKNFQQAFGYPEDIWKFESIYKDCQRNGVFSRCDKELQRKIHEIILSQMSKDRTLTNLGKKAYEEI